jgi:glycosyltransferase involved in cell wall biosynthesis
MHIVLSMITKNSYEKVGNYFDRLWESSLQVPYDLIILIDDSDTDKTRGYVKKFAQEHGKEVIIERSRLYGWRKPTRATARQTAIDIFFQNTIAEWLFFLDDDVILKDGWWDETRSYLSEEMVGLVWGVDYTEMWEERMKYFNIRKLDYTEYAINNFKKRGGLHDTLLRRTAIEGMMLPPWLNVYEDAWIKRYIECRGYTTLDMKIAIYADSILRLEAPSYLAFLKNLFGLPAYLYYGFRSGINGWEIWKTRVSYRYGLLKTHSKCRLEPCEVVLGYRSDDMTRRKIDKCVTAEIE